VTAFAFVDVIYLSWRWLNLWYFASVFNFGNSL